MGPRPPKGAQPPIFGPCLLRPNGCMNQDRIWHGGGFRWPHCTRWVPCPPHKKGHSPPVFSPCLLWPNGWMDKMPLGTEIGLGPDDIVLDGSQLPHPPSGAWPPIFGPCLLWPNSCPSQLLLSSCVTYLLNDCPTYI